MKKKKKKKRTKPIVPGEIYGSLKVLRKTNEKQGLNYLFECECLVCGIISKKIQYYIRQSKGDYKKDICFCTKEPIKINETYGVWTVLEKSNKKRKSGTPLYKCKDNRGNIRYRSSGDLRRSSKRNLDIALKCSRSGELTNGFPNHVYATIVGNAKGRGRSVEINHSYLANLLKNQDNKCALTGIYIKCGKTQKEHQKLFNSASLDRIDSNKGYIEGNLQFVLGKINMMKNTYSQEEFIEMCRSVAEFDDRNKEK